MSSQHSFDSDTRFLAVRDGYAISAEPSLIDLDTVHRFLAEESYWRRGVLRSSVERAISGSVCFGVYQLASAEPRMVGFVRFVTDGSTFAWMDDLFVLPQHRGRGLGHWLVDVSLNHPTVAGAHLVWLVTADAEEFYAAHEFRTFALGRSIVMVRAG